MDRRALIAALDARLGKRQLVWAGIRGDDVESLTDLPQTSACYSIIGAYAQRGTITSLAVEEISKRRVDLESWDIDDYRQTDDVLQFRRALLNTLGRPSALLPYRPSRFLSAIWFARRDLCLNLGLFGAHQFAFEHKPWVETSLAHLGIATVPWTYVADEERWRAKEMLKHGPILLRVSRTSGGQGFSRVDDADHFDQLWPDTDEAFVGAAPYLSDMLPINIGATVWRDGVTVHYPSIQLIGIAKCVTRPFGYCGNDFGRARELEPARIDEIEERTVCIGHWLRTKGYRGSFGVDYLLGADGVLRFTEVNARFQGSTCASARLSIEADRACLPLEHIAAMLDLDAPAQVPLRDLVNEITPLAHVVVHWTGARPAHLDPTSLHQALARRHTSSDVATRPELLTDPGGVVTRLTFRQGVTTTGFDLLEPVSSAVDSWNDAMTGMVAKWQEVAGV